jgi:amino acid transporter
MLMESDKTAGQSKRRLPLWVALAMSLALTAPTLAMSANGQSIIGTVGKAVPIVFIIGFVGVSLVGYGFIRLTRRFNHAGSVYALVGVTIGPRAGFFSGWAMLGAYVGFAIGDIALVADFVNAFLAAISQKTTGAPHVSWLVVAVACSALVALLAAVDAKLAGRILMIIEGAGIIGMIILAAVIFGKGGASSTGVDFSAFTIPSGIGFSGVVAGVVAAFLSWAGFEACAALGEETDNPQRNIPRALGGTLLITGAIYVVVMFAETIGFGTSAAGLDHFSTSGNTLGQLGQTYVARWFGLALIFAGICSAFASILACVSTGGRLLFAFSRDGFGPGALARLDTRTQTPRDATWWIIGFSLVVNVICWGTGWPRLGTGIASLDSYIYFASAGVVALMLAYLLTEVAAIVFGTSARFRPEESTLARVVGLVLPALGIVVILTVLWYNVKGQHDPWISYGYLGIAWSVVGLAGALLARKAVQRMRVSLAQDLGQSAGVVADGESLPA